MPTSYPQLLVDYLAANFAGVPVLMEAYYSVVLPAVRVVNGKETAFLDPISMDAACEILRAKARPLQFEEENSMRFIRRIGPVYHG